MIFLNRTIKIVLFLFFISECTAQDFEFIKNKKIIQYQANVQGDIRYCPNYESEHKLLYHAGVNANIDLLGLQFPFQFYYSNKRLDTKLPAIQSGFSPKYKWITVHILERNFNSGKHIGQSISYRGGGIDLNFKKYKQKLFLGKNNVIDRTYTNNEHFQLGTSIEFQIKKSEINSTIVYTSFDKDYKHLGMEIGYTNTIGKKVKVSTMAAFTQPFHQRDSIRYTPGYATEWSLSFPIKRAELQMHYQFTDQNFRMPGNNRINTNNETFGVGLSSYLLKNKCQIQGNIGWQRDNLKSGLEERHKQYNTFIQLNGKIEPNKIMSTNIAYSNQQTKQDFNPTPNSYDSLSSLNVSEFIQIEQTLILGKNNPIHFSANYRWMRTLLNGTTRAQQSQWGISNRKEFKKIKSNLLLTYSGNTEVIGDRHTLSIGTQSKLFKKIQFQLNYMFSVYSTTQVHILVLNLQYTLFKRHQFHFNLTSQEQKYKPLQTQFRLSYQISFQSKNKN